MRRMRLLLVVSGILAGGCQHPPPINLHDTAQSRALLAAQQQRLQELREAVQREPQHADAHFLLGTLLYQVSEPAEAVTALREALRLRPEWTAAHSRLGSALYQTGDVEGALAEYRRVVQLQPDLADAHLNLGTALMVTRQWAEAAAALQTALRLQPDLVQAHYRLGLVRYTLGDVPGAMAAYRRVLQLKPEDADAHYHLGLLLTLTNQDREAVAALLVAAQAGLPKAQYFLGTAYAAGLGVERDLPAAITWWTRAADQGLSQAKEALADLRARGQLHDFSILPEPRQAQPAP